MATQNAWNSPNFESFQDQNNTGFQEWGGSGNYYSVAGTTFTLLRAGSGYIKNVPVTWNGSQNTGALAAGNTYYVYIDSSGIIGTTTTRSATLFKENIVLFEVLVDALSNVIVVKENHPYDFPVDSSEYLHWTIGPVIENNLGGANIALNGTKGIQINGNDYLADHGLETLIPDSSATAVNFSFMYTNGAGKWARSSIANTFPSTYNNAGTPTALTAAKYGVFRLYVSKEDLNSSTPTYYAVMHTAEFNNQTAATTAISSGTIATPSNEFYNIEVAQLGYVIKEESSDTIVDVIVAKGTLKTSTSIAVSNSASLINTDTTNFNGVLSSADTTVQAALETLDDAFTAANTSADTSSFNGVLSAADNTVQKALDTLDDAFTAANTSADTSSFNGVLSAADNTVQKALDTLDDAFTAANVSADTSSFSGNLSSSDNTVQKALDTLDDLTVGKLSGSLVNARVSSEISNVTGDGTTYTIIFDTETYDTNSEYNNATGIFTATNAGKYLVNVNVGIRGVTASHTGFVLSFNSPVTASGNIFLNPYAAYNTGYGTLSICFSRILDMSASQTVKVDLFISGGTKVIDIASGSYFEITQLA